MTEKSGLHLGYQDLGSGFALWVSEIIQDGRQQFSKGQAIVSQRPFTDYFLILTMPRRGQPPKYETEEERMAAKRAQNARRQREYKDRQRVKQEAEASASNQTLRGDDRPEEEAHLPHPDSRNTLSGTQFVKAEQCEEESSCSTVDNPAERPLAAEEDSRESRANPLYWATLLVELKCTRPGRTEATYNIERRCLSSPSRIN